MPANQANQRESGMITTEHTEHTEGYHSSDQFPCIPCVPWFQLRFIRADSWAVIRSAQKNFLALSKKLFATGSSASPLIFANSSRILRCSLVSEVGTSTCTRTN